MGKKLKQLFTIALALGLCISSTGTFTFATETSEEPVSTVNISLIKYTGAALQEDDEYDGPSVSIDGKNYPVQSNVEFQLCTLEEEEYVTVKEGLVTDENGYLIVKDLPADAEYYFQETKPAKGFLLSDEYIEAIPWTDEEIITYASSTFRELPPDEYIDESFEESEETPADVEEESTQDLPENEADTINEDTVSSTENPNTGDNSLLLTMMIILAAASAAAFLLKKKA